MDSIVNNLKKNKHLTLDDRLIIQQGLNAGYSFKNIATTLGKDPSTISKEVRNHRMVATNHWTLHDDSGNVLNDNCPLTAKPPYVCNACIHRPSCRLKRFLYNGPRAHKEYVSCLSASREGTPLSTEDFYKTAAILEEGIKKGQHLYHIQQAYNLPVSLSTIYRHMHKGYYDFSSIDCPRVVRFKPRKPTRKNFVPNKMKQGRTYEDFKSYASTIPLDHWVEMDTVIGHIGGKVLLTLLFTNSNFMFARLLNNKSASEVALQFKLLRKAFQKANLSFATYFPVILTDNGGEFADVDALEKNEKGIVETHLFFCEPMRPDQKGKVEKNHTLFRDICPKGSSFDDLTQEKVNTIFSHINSTSRAKFNGKTPYELFTYIYGVEIATVLGIQKISKKDVIQSKQLLNLLGVTAF